MKQLLEKITLRGELMNNNEFRAGFSEFLIYFVDVTIVLFSIYITFMLRYNFKPSSYNYDSFILSAPWIVIAYLLLMFVFGLNDILKQSLGETIYSVFLTVASMMFVTAFITFFLRGFSYPRLVLILSTLMQFLLLSVWRGIVWKIRRMSHGIKNSLVIGNDAMESISKKIILKQSDLYRIKYICSDKSRNLNKYVDDVDVVFMCNDIDLNLKKEVVDKCLTGRKSIYIIPDIYEIALLNSKLSKADDIPMLKVKKLGLNFEQKFLKRVLDIALSLVALVLASPVMLVMAFLIKQDGGNVFYKQERVTEGEATFDVLKFRTMVMNAEKLSGPVLAGEDDPRITKIGKFMRSTRIDELPQIINILKGEMSLVGPRPERPFFVQQFKNEIPDYKYRTTVKAGLTGLAQVWGKYSTTPEDKVRYDMIYIKNYSILLDLKLILQTIKIMFMKESSAGVVNEEYSLDDIAKSFLQDIKIDKE
jgi:exopolysaccharide biosynthesis polyprenyl glycosylphosphotransferase